MSRQTPNEASPFERARAECRARWERLADRTSEHHCKPVLLRGLWERVCAGDVVFRDAFLSPRHALLVTGSAPASRELRHRPNLMFLQHALDCTSLTAAAIDYRLSASSATTRAKGALRWIGLPTTAAKIPLSLVLVAHAACCPTGHAVLQFPDPADPDSKILFTARPDLALCESLPPCEAETVRLFVDGRSHAEIASHRGARPRTIANQLGSVFRKLEVSGRLELLRALACSNVAQQSSAWRVA